MTVEEFEDAYEKGRIWVSKHPYYYFVVDLKGGPAFYWPETLEALQAILESLEPLK